MLVLVLVLEPGIEETEDVVKGPDTVGAPVVSPTPATELDSNVEVVVILEVVTVPVLLTLVDSDEILAVTVSLEAPVLTTVALSALVLSARTAALYELSAADSALLTASLDILSCVPLQAVWMVCKGAVRNSG